MLKQFFILLLIILPGLAKAQPASPDCITAFTVQSGFAVAITNTTGPGNVIDLTANSTHSISNPLTNPIPGNSGCLFSGEPMPSWYIFRICNTGTFQILIGSDINQYQQGGYYDWSLWKYNATTCSKIFNNQLAPLRCNWNGAQTGGTGICDTLSLPPNGVKPNYEPPLPVTVGDSLIMCLNNYSAINYIIDFLSVGTSSINNCPTIVTAIKPITAIKAKQLFYNALTNKIEVRDKNIHMIIIHDAQGKEILKTKIEESGFIDCSNFSKGIYFVTCYTKENLPVTEKILVN